MSGHKVALVLGMCHLALGQLKLTTLSVCPPSGCTPTSPTFTATVTPTLSSTSTTSSTPTTTETATPASGTHRGTGISLFLTTAFTAPTQCYQRPLTSIAPDTTADENDLQLWGIAIDDSVHGAYTSCLPSQFYSSYNAEVSGTHLPPFSKLVCPYKWETYPINSTYIICCPGGYNVLLNREHPERLGFAALCYSTIWQDVLMYVTSYDLTGGSTVIETTGPVNGTAAYADGYDGTPLTPLSAVTPITLQPLASTDEYITSSSTDRPEAMPKAASLSSSSSAKPTGKSGAGALAGKGMVNHAAVISALCAFVCSYLTHLRV